MNNRSLFLLLSAWVFLVHVDMAVSWADVSNIECHLPSGAVVTTTERDCKSRIGLVLPERGSQETVPINNENRMSSAKTSHSSDGYIFNKIQSRLEMLKSLLEKGLITKDEAAAKRKAILDSM